MGKKTEVSLPSAEFVRAMFTYDPETGECVWKTRPPEHFKNHRAWVTWNATWPGKVVGCRRTSMRGGKIGIVTMHNGRWVLLHRLIWVYAHGEDPAEMHIDHINNDSYDNRLNNLRLATKAQNCRNSKLPKNNTSGYKGVTKNRIGKWVAQITVNRANIYLGSFFSPEEAHEAYCKAAALHFGEFARTK